MFDFSEFEVKGNVCRTYEDDSEEEDPEDQVAGEDLLPIQNEAPDQDDAEDELFDGTLKISKCSLKYISYVLDGIDVCSILCSCRHHNFAHVLDHDLLPRALCRIINQNVCYP